MFFKRLIAAWVFLLAACFWQGTAQTNQGALAGTVVDQSGATVEGANITVKSQATGLTLSAVSSADGAFRFPSLPIGQYDATATRSGFSTVTQTGIGVQINSTAAVTLTLSVGNATQTVTVQAEATRIESESSDIGTVVTTRQVIELPLALGGVGALRSPEAFTFLTPGVTGPGTANSSNGIFLSKIGGGQNFGNEVLLDGASILRSENGSSFDEAAPSVEAIQEFKVLTATFPAVYGRTSGGIESFTIKSGTNDFHGTAYDIFRNEKLDANSWFNNGNAARCAPGDQACRAPFARSLDRKNDYGVNLGGPVWIPKIYNGRNKSFFFFNWEQYRQNNGAVATSTVPTAAQRNGDFSANLGPSLGVTNPCDGSTILRNQIFDPTTERVGANGTLCRTAFPGNRIPVNRISQVSQNFLSYYPTPNTTGANGINYAFAFANPLYNTTYTVRVDQNFSDKIRFFATYDSRENQRIAGGPQLSGVADPGGWNQDFLTHYGRAGFDFILSPTFLDHLNLGYNRTNSQNFSPGAFQAIAGNFDWPSRLGLKNSSGTNFPIINFGDSGIPAMSSGHDDDNIDNGIRVNDYASWSKGAHSLTFGFDFRNQLYSTFGFGNYAGTYNFNRNSTAATADLTSTTGFGLASFILGAVNDANRGVTGHVARWVSQYYAGFVQDDWKVSQHLTLNLGVRYDVDVPRRESFNDTSNYSLTAPNPAAGGRPGAMVFGSTCTPGCNPRWANTYYKDVAPRVGFSWSPSNFNDRFVLRGGYGIYYSPLQYTDFGGAQQQGYSATPNFISSNSFTPYFNWDNGFPAFAPAPNTNPSLLNGQGGPNYIDPSYGRPGMIQSWSLQTQTQVSKDMVATLGYVGQRSTYLRSQLLNLNNINPANFALGSALNQPVNTNTIGVAAPYPNFFTDYGQGVTVQQALRPFPQNKFISSDALQNIGQASYHSLQATLQRRFSAGLSVQASFSWQKIITDADSILPGINGGINQIQNPSNLRDEKALSSQDVPYTFTSAFLYELPFGRGKRLLSHGLAGAIIGGWQIGGVLRYQTGVPVSFGCANSIPGWDNCIRFNRVPGVSPLSASALNGTFDPFVNLYYNPAGFADPNANRAPNAAYRFGNYPRNAGDIRAPNFYNEDFSFIRNFHIFESVTLQAKGEMLNAFNRHILSIPNNGDATAPTNQSFGRVTDTVESAGFGGFQRVVQFTLRLNF